MLAVCIKLMALVNLLIYCLAICECLQHLIISVDIHFGGLRQGGMVWNIEVAERVSRLR